MRIFRHPKTDIIWIDFNINGKRHRKSTKIKYSPKNMKMVEKDVAPAIQASIMNGTFELGGEKKNVIFFSDIYEMYFTSLKNHAREKTVTNKDAIYKLHIKDTFHNRILKEIKKKDIDLWISDLKTKNLEDSTVSQYKSQLSSIFEVALENEYIEKNPVSIVKLKGSRESGEVQPFNIDDFNNIIEASEKKYPYMKSAILFLYSTGMRPSEALALTWDDIDFEHRKINIDKSLALKGEIKSTKTKSSIRVIDMLDIAKEVLEYEKERTKIFGFNRVFLSQYDTPFRDYTGWSTGFKKTLKEAKINNGTLYNLRHTFASTLITKGADMLWVSKTLGHKDLNTTFTYYAKFVKPTEEERKNKINEYGSYLAHSKK